MAGSNSLKITNIDRRAIEILQQAAKNKNISARALADITNLSKWRINQILTGRAAPTLGEVVTLGQSLDIPLTRFAWKLDAQELTNLNSASDPDA